MDLELRDKLALVTGSTAGIGAAIAAGLAREGARAVVNGRTEHRVSSTIKSIQQKFPQAKVEGFTGDLATADGFEALKEKILSGNLPRRAINR